MAGHPYAYVSNNPVNLIDPYGLDACDVVAGWFGGDDECRDVANDVACSPAQTVVGCGLVGLGPLGDSYFDYNVTAGCVFNITFGFQYKASQGVHTYGGSGGGSCGASGSFSVGYNYDITPGTNCGLQGSLLFLPWGPGFFGLSGQLGFAKEGTKFNPFALLSSSDDFREVGVSYGQPAGFGYAGTCYDVRPIRGLSW